ncbi:MAG: diadenylate cyclase CdaA [Chloroflexota bacterium]
MQLLDLLFDILFRLSILDGLGWLDLFLVAIVCFVLLRLLRRSQAASLLRGALILILLLLIVTILFPLPTFDWLVRGTLLVLLIATPMVLQPEIRRALERIGRQTGLSLAVRQTTAETILPHLVRTVETFAATRTGALIVVEGVDSLQPYVDTGISIDSLVTAELLQTIFFDKTPLHDGAAVISGNRIVAAGCVLPLTGRQIRSYRRLGTRHRAAIGLSEVSDALVIIVSEETGDISIALRGELHSRLDGHTLRQVLYDYLTGGTSAAAAMSLPQLLQEGWGLLHKQFNWPSREQFWQNVGLVIITAVITLTIWSFVITQTNPTVRETFINIPLQVAQVPDNMALVANPPSSISAVVRTTSANMNNLRPDSFLATVTLDSYGPGQHQIPITVHGGDEIVQVLYTEPGLLPLELAAVISRTLPISMQLNDPQNLSAAYELSGPLTASPLSATVTGPQPLLDQIYQIQAALSVSNATTTIREARPLRALDAAGNEVAGVVLEPAQAQVTLPISRRRDALDVGIRAVTEGSPPEGYWLSSLSVTPASVTLQGEPTLLSGLNGFVDTLPVDLREAAGPLSIQVPLNLPTGITAVDNNGIPIYSVTVNAQVSARTGDLLLERPIEVLGIREGVTVTIDPQQLELLISGPLPALNEIEQNPNLVRIILDISEVAPISGQTVVRTPRLVIPEGVQTQLIRDTVLVTMIRD